MPKGRFAEDLTGRQFSRLTVVRLFDNVIHRPRWVCICECGKEAIAYAHHLKSGTTRSCGCLLADVTRIRSTTHGESGSGDKSRQSPEYQAWSRMKERVGADSAKYRRLYADRGITMCDRWRSFENFVEDMGRRPSPGLQLDRIDNERGYEPGNVRWATSIQQQRNKRQNIQLTIDNETLYLTEWAEKFGVKAATIRKRLSKGWNAKRAVFEKPAKRRWRSARSDRR